MASKRKKKTPAFEASWLRAPPPPLQPFDPGRDWIGLALIFIAALALYAASTPRTVMLEDDGLFISAAYFAGVAHPPGYPLFVALGWLMSHIPFGGIAWRVHTLSGVMGAVTCVCIAWLVFRRTGNRPAACIAAAALAVSEHFWSQAIIADVYTTNTAVLFVTLVLVQEAAAKRDARLWAAAAVVYGLGLANHWPLLLLGSPVLLAPLIATGKDFRRRLHYVVPLVLLAAASLYGWMVWRSHQSPPVNFMGAIESWSALAAFIGRDIYAGIDTSVNAGLTDKLLYVKYFVTESLLQFSLLGGVVALWGAVACYRRGWRLGVLCEAAALTSSSFVLIALLGFDYEYFRVAWFRPYVLVAYCILALWLGCGIHALAQKARARAANKAVVPAAYAAFALVLAALGFWNADVNYRPHDRFASEQARMVLSLVERGAVFVPYGDAYVFPITYLHFVEGERPDLRILETRGLLLDDRVVQLLWGRKRREAAWAEFFDRLERPGYFQALGPVLSGLGHEHLGFMKRINRGIQPGKISIASHDAAKAYFKKLIAMPAPKDHWIGNHRNSMLQTYGGYLGFARAINHAPLQEHIADVLPLAESNYWALVGMAGTLLQQPGDQYVQLAADCLRKAERIAGDERSKAQRANFFHLAGMVERRRGNMERAKALFLKSVQTNRSKRNPARQKLQQLPQAGT